MNASNPSGQPTARTVAGVELKSQAVQAAQTTQTTISHGDHGARALPFVVTLAGFAATASASHYRDTLSLQVADSVIALLAGLGTAEGQAIRAFVERTEGASILGAVTWLAASMRLTEIDDIHRPSAVTSSAIALPATLAMATLTRHPGGTAGDDAMRPARFADALFVGQELSIRLARALGGAALMTQGWWPSYLVAPFGAAAAAARMLDLPRERVAHALALAISQTPQQIGRTVGSRPGRWLLFGNAVRSGCLAALAAADGIDGDLELLGEGSITAMRRSSAPPLFIPLSRPLSRPLPTLFILPIFKLRRSRKSAPSRTARPSRHSRPFMVCND
jgi:hypothetical protein